MSSYLRSDDFLFRFLFFHSRSGDCPPSVRNVRAHREMVINIERTGFVVLVHIITNDSRSK